MRLISETSFNMLTITFTTKRDKGTAIYMLGWWRLGKRGKGCKKSFGKEFLYLKELKKNYVLTKKC